MKHHRKDKPPPAPSLEAYHNDHLCVVCGEYGAYGHSEPGARIDNIRWYCAEHRPVKAKDQQIGVAA